MKTRLSANQSAHTMLVVLFKRVSKYDCTIRVTKSTWAVPSGILSYVILSISYLRERTIETSSLPYPRIPCDPWQSKFFSRIPTAYFNCKYFSVYARELLGCLPVISPSGRNPCGSNKQITPQKVLSEYFIHSLANFGKLMHPFADSAFQLVNKNA